METRYNLKSIVKIDIVDKRINEHILYCKPYVINLLFTKIYIKEKYSDYFDGDKFTKQELLDNNYIIEDNMVYNKPYVFIEFNNKVNFRKTFETITEAYNWVIKNIEPHIHLTKI